MHSRPWWRAAKEGAAAQRLSLQTCLLALVLLVLVPTLGVVATTLLRAGQSYREASTNQLLETANVVAQSVESELQAKSHLLSGYAPSASTASNGIDADALFEGHLGSARIGKNATDLPANADRDQGVLADLAQRAASAGKMAVSNVFISDVGTKPSPSIAIAVPHATAGTDVEVTTLITQPTVLIQTLMRQGAFANALLLAVTDGTGKVIARSRDPEKFIGKPVPDWGTLTALRTANGTFEARTIEGSKVIFAFQMIHGTPGWVAVVGEPLKVFNSRWQQPITVLLIAAATTIFVAFNLAMLLARRILRPIKLLAERARAVADGGDLDRADSIAASPSFVAEFETLRQSLESAEIETRRSHYALQQSYQSLREAERLARIAERAKSDFLATMSHEIRTPMNTVIGMTRLTLQTDLAPKQRNYLEKIDVSAKTLLGIINDVLDFSKIEAGSLELEDTVFTLESVLESISAIMAMPAEEKGLEIAYAVAAEVPSRLRGDPLRLGQVLTNLVSNAVKFTESGEVVISIESSSAPNGSPVLQFAVRDTGIGLSAEQIRGLFQPFTQAAHDTARKYGGTGLGLAICSRLVERMGGAIWVESVPGKGSAFFFTIPSRPVGGEDASGPSVHQSSHLANRRVLIVDDNASARDILCDMISEFGLTVEAVNSGAQALALLRSEANSCRPFDLVLMDWRMPTMDGLETARRIREDDRLLHMPAVLMVTAYGREGVLLGVQQLGLEGVLIKPITKSVMFNTLMEILSPSNCSAAIQPAWPARDPLYDRLVGKRILVVDDHSLNREVASDFLLAVGVMVDTAANGADALAKLESHDFDAVLMDMHMPVMDGLTAVREIRTRPRWSKLPVIALTAQARIEDQNAGLEAGMTAHLTKPIDEIVLYRTLIAVLGLALEQDAGLLPIKRDASTTRAEETGTNFRLSTALKRFGGKSGRVDRLLMGFLRDFADAPQQLERHLSERSSAEVASLAHAIKGSAGYFCAQDFCAAAERLEQAARDDDVQQIEIESREFNERLKRLLGEIHGGLADLRGLDERTPGEFDQDAVLAAVTRAVALVQRGDYAASLLLEEIRASLTGHSEEDLANEAQAHFDELELEAAVAALDRLRRRLEAVRVSDPS